MGDRTALGVRCGHCSAVVRPGAPWCTQCYARVPGPGTAAPTVPVPAPVSTGPAAVAVTAAATAAPAPAVTSRDSPRGSWPCHSCGEPNALAEPACTACGTPFLAAVRAARPTVVLPVVGDLLALSPVRRIGLAVGVVVAFVLLTALLGLLLA